ncbi:hypothetical protein CJ030_MR2G008599 [Morella rubra]|uniref:Protein kinase domain-containing protein n=1 Tax=Morella rubra TaxID=262757 RepID=A0A6A1WEP4_9ROSI|nr:hypothetical protein CJ030_MR2G008599 [Morella rubra]
MGLAGTIPPHVGNLSFLVSLSVANNSFFGFVLSELSRLDRLKEIDFSFNSFNGEIPSSLGLLSRLQLLILRDNSFTGTIPSSLCNISSLRKIYLGFNTLTGFMPSSMFNLSSLQVISLPENKLSGPIPSIFFDMPSLQCKQLYFLGLWDNNFKGKLPPEIGNLTMLSTLDIGINNFEGAIPSEIGNLRNLEYFFVSRNNFTGWIPYEIFNISSLQLISMAVNKLSGQLPSNIGLFLPNLKFLYVGDNKLSGTIPNSISNASQLLEINKLSGQIPPCISNLTSLRELYVGFNQLSSVVPLSLWSLIDIQVVNLSSNFLSGSLSFHIGDMKVLQVLDLSINQLGGDIPTTIGGLKDLVNLSLADNRLEGSIPKSFGIMVSLEYLDLSNNQLYGEIPKSLEALLYLRFLNVSFNKLRGKIPTGGPFVNFSATSFISNDALCGAPRLQVSPCKQGLAPPKVSTKVHRLEYILPTIGLLILGVFAVLFWTKCKKRKAKSSSEVELPPLVTWRRVSQQELIRATEGFSLNNLIGEGSFGSVYKGTLSDGTNVAIKVLNLLVEGAFPRLNIMIDVAAALEYLHFGNATPIVHCDLKPSNVLLDEDMVAHVADFGIAKLMGDGDSMTQTMTLATIGYMAPEYGLEGIVSTRGDVYSYGILLMETFTSKRPTDSMFTGGMSLKHWIEESLPISVTESF